jgi:hypothetical protein
MIMMQKLATLKQMKSKYESVKELTFFLYSNIPELYIDTEFKNHKPAEINKDNALSLLQEFADCKKTALCGEYAAFAKYTCEYVGAKEFEVKICSMSLNDGYLLNHTVAIIMYLKNNEPEYYVIDAMYGYVLKIPHEVIDGKMSEEMVGNLDYLSDEQLKQKRFLTNKIWPCNFSMNYIIEYYYTPAGSLAKFEFNEPENIQLLNIYNYSERIYKRDLIRLVKASF